jgi:TM2 domain-containing membrane protein YozV
MRVAPHHVRTAVACPHCRQIVEPWRLAQRPGGGVAGSDANDWAGYSWRNRWVAGALAILLGVFGLHRFYLGFTGIGLVQVALTVGSFLALSPVVAIWTFIEGVLCFCGAMRDVEGRPLRG